MGAPSASAPPASAGTMRAPASAANLVVVIGTVLERPTAEHTFPLEVPFRGQFVTVPCRAPDMIVRQLGPGATVLVHGCWAPSVAVEMGFVVPTVLLAQNLASVPELGLKERQIGANMTWIAGRLPSTKIDLAARKVGETPHGTLTLRLDNRARLPLALVGEPLMRRVGMHDPGDRVVVGGPVVRYRDELCVLVQQWARAY